MRRGAFLEAAFLGSVTGGGHGFEVVNPTAADRSRATQLVVRLVSAPAGYVDATVVAMAERLGVSAIATVDFKMIGMMGPVCALTKLRWVLQES